MSGEGYRALLDCRRRATTLRARSFTYDQIADVLALDHHVSPLRLYRYAHGRTASNVVAAHNDLDPAGTAGLREARLYDYEAWPTTGRRAPARTVAILACLYQTTARRLLPDEVYASYGPRDRDLLDRTDHRHLDPHQRLRAAAPASRDEELPAWSLASTPPTHDSMKPQPAPARVPPPGPAHCAELLRALSAEEADLKRRELLFELALLLGGTPALGLLRHLTPSERERLAAAAHRRTPLDSGTLDLLERLMTRLWAMDERLGPEHVLPVAEAKRALVGDLLHQGSLTPAPRERLLRLYWSLSHLMGWSHFDLNDYTNATHRYAEGLAVAHELRAPALLAHIHGLMANMFLHRNKPTVAMDHIFAAEEWAKRSGNRLQQAATLTALARVLSGASRDDAGLRTLDRAMTLAEAKPDDPQLRHLFWCNPRRINRHLVFCLVELNQPDRAIAEAKRIMKDLPPEWSRERGLLHLEYATALIQKREIPTAAAMIGEAARETTGHSSARLTQAIRHTRSRLQPWQDNKHIRDLDEQLRTLSITG
ncbi:hypothetical protein [Streptosporangium sp. NPDC006007]|uniref:hypothetical protein n=1 Tax=Streptosporangium sp. NPDC006007 TaxID=3154575 RepID=UPI0033A73818